MKKILYFLIFPFYLTTLVFAQDTRWVRTVISAGYDDCLDMVADSSGYVYVTGQIEYTATLGNTTLTSEGQHDIFIAKYDSVGNLIWANRAGGSDGDIGYAIAVDTSGNSYVVGEFETTSHFDGITKSVVGSGNNMFIAKYDTSGHVVWVKSIGTNSGDTKGYAVACDPQGNVYACGTTRARAIYSGSTLFSSRGSEDIILIKFDTDGHYLWNKQIGGSDSDEGFGLAYSGAYVYVTGSFEGSCKFTSSISLSSNSGSKDFFIAKYDSSGTFKWAKKGGGSGDDIGRDVAVNTNGNIICTGEFKYTGTFGSNSISGSGNNDMFAVAYDENGTNLWARKAGGSSFDFGNNISHDYSGNILIGGTFMGHATFDQVQITSNGNEDAFLLSYDSAGNFRFVKTFGGPAHDIGQGVGADKYGNIYFCGEFWTHINFDTSNVQGLTMFDGFVVRIGNYPVCSISTTITHEISCNNACDGSVLVTPSGLPPFTYTWPLFPQQHSENLVGLCVGNYPVLITDAYGCVSTTTVVVSQPLPVMIDQFTIFNTTCTGCNDGSINIDAGGGTAPYSYYWSDGSTAQNRLHLSAGNYVVCIIDANGCSYCDTLVVQSPMNGINDIYNSSLVKVFPNPVKNQTEIHLDKTLHAENYRIELYNSIGEIIISIPVHSNVISLMMNEYSNGIYYLKLNNKESGEVKSITPLLVQH